jgi:hypothetical protein
MMETSARMTPVIPLLAASTATTVLYVTTGTPVLLETHVEKEAVPSTQT